ncbi:helix-turn-helix transcriptional regulator [Thermopirellula anaerolimosa]
MSRQAALVRQWTILRILSSRHYGATVRELAAELNVSTKTIRRDLETFALAGFPIEETVVEYGRKRWKLRGDASSQGVFLAYDEAIALHLGRSFMEPLAGTMFWEAAQSAFQKIRTMFKPDALRYVQQLAGAFHATTFGRCDYSRMADLIDELVIAVEERKVVQLSYRSLKAKETATYPVCPYGFTFHRGALYLVGLAVKHNEIRHWKMNRVENVETTAETFEIPEDFSLKEHLAKSFGIFQGEGDHHVRVLFSPQVARYVSESQWHASQTLLPQSDGSLIAEFDLDGTEEIARWVLSFGKHAEVLDPPDLRAAVAAEVAEMNHRYEPMSEHATKTCASRDDYDKRGEERVASGRGAKTSASKHSHLDHAAPSAVGDSQYLIRSR